ncbi:MAG: OB-fold nucleic acid binding domain-containing protein, partial [Candidatus Rokuibacteriota bacterium]
MAPPRPVGAARGGAGPPATHPLATPLQFLKGVGPQRAKLLANLGLHAVEDALYYLPARHEDRSQLTPLRSLKPDDVTTVTGTIRAISPPPRGRPRVPLSVLLSDGTGYLTCVWFGQAYLERLFQRGQRLIVHGKAQRYRSGPLQMHVKDYEIVEDEAGEGATDPLDETLHTGRLVPVYGLTRGLTARPMRRLMKRLVDAYVDNLEDPLPATLRARHRLEPLAPALRAG